MQSRHFGWSTTTTIAWNGFPHLVGCNLSIYGNILEPPPYGHNICLQAFTTLSWYQIPFKLNLAAEPIFTEISFLFSVSCGWHYLGDSKHLAECRLSSFKGKGHAACHMLMIPWYKLCSFTRDDKSGYNVRGRSWQHHSCFPHCSQESSELSQAEPVLSWNLFCLQAAAPSHIPTPALPAPPAQLLKLLLPVPHITFTPSSSIWSWSRFEGLNLQWFRAMSMRTTGNGFWQKWLWQQTELRRLHDFLLSLHVQLINTIRMSAW